MNDYIRLNTVAKKQANFFNVLVSLSFLSFIVLLISVLILDSKIINVVSLVVLLLSGMLISLTKSYSLSGYVVLYFDHVDISNDDLEITIDSRDLSDIRFIYHGYDGEAYYFNPRSITYKDGTDNYIKFTYKGEKYSIQVLLKKGDSDLVKSIVNKWNCYKSTDLTHWPRQK